MSYIIYLHPKCDSEAYNQLYKFWENGKQTIPGNLAFTYPFHATLVSFFDTEEPEVVAEYAKKYVSEVMPKITAQCPGIKGDGTFKYVDVKSPQIDSFINAITERFKYIRSRVVGQLHITLTHQISDSSIPTAAGLIEKIDISKWTDDWTIVMWNKNTETRSWKIVSVIA